jgi:UDP-N-acetylglucosamine 4,6-dehydratase
MSVTGLMPDRDTYSEYFRGKRILVTGGTGSFGNQIIKELLAFSPERIVVYSRDEKKQYDMQDQYGAERSLHFAIGDVRDAGAVMQAMRGIDIVYHAAALKQVPNCERYPMEAVLTNIMGAENVRRAALAHGVRIVISVSTDKAVKPVNAMGMTKALAEKVLLAEIPGAPDATRFVMVRYGNVIGSRGSVAPLFAQRIAQNRPLPITDPAMTRFLLTLPEAIDLVFHATAHGRSGHLYVRRMPACTVLELARSMAKCQTGRSDYPMTITGIRPGEKMHETLVSEEEMIRAEESRWYYDIHPVGTFIAPERRSSGFGEYRSDNTERLSEDELAQLLATAGWATRPLAHAAVL